MKKTTPSRPNFRPTPLEQEVILAHILKKSREYVLAHPEIRLTTAQKRQFEKMIDRRKNHEPIAYILDRKEFYGLNFKVDKNTLIPRPETEILVEEILRLNPENENIIDIGTGSGNIIITLAKNIKNKNNYFGIDISPKALMVAKSNVKKNNIEKKIKFIKSDLLKFFIQDTKYKIQDTILVANLPYLSKKIYEHTLPDVQNFEPKSALLSGHDGLDHYRKLFKQIKNLEDKNYKLKAILEISPEQKTKIAKLAKYHFPCAKLKFQKDLAGKWRMVDIDISA